MHCLEAAVQAAEIALTLTPIQRRRTIWRLDGGSGSERELHWLVERGYQIVAKGINYHRACALARRVPRWDPFGDVWIGEVPAPMDYARPVRVFIKRKRKGDGSFHYSYYVTTLPFASKRLFQTFYNARGGAEVEQFRNDKSGLGLEARRKYSFLGQKAFILLTDLAHNLLADFGHRGLRGTKLQNYGPQRMVRDLLNLPGHLEFDTHGLSQIQLLSLKQISSDLRMCLVKYCSGPES